MSKDIPEFPGWVRRCDRLPPFEDRLRVMVFTHGHEFAGEQVFDVPVKNLYPADSDHWFYGHYDTEVGEVVTHWRYRPGEDPDPKKYVDFEIAKALADVLAWYGIEAASVQKFAGEKDANPDALMACVHVLGSDGGRRAIEALKKWKEVS